MDQLSRSEKQPDPGRDFFHFLILDQRGTTDELKALTRELEILLEDVLTARPELRVAYQDLLVVQEQPLPSTRQAKPSPQEMDLAQIRRETERNLVRSRELI